jgi:purine-cytosine permease-like protein
VSTPRSQDRFGKVEQAGVEYIPESARDSRPLNLLAVFIGSNLTWSIVIFGWLPVALGLNFWGAFTSSLTGLVLGCLVMGPIATIGTRTGTNTAVSSGAFFGIRGRLIGSGLALVLAIAYGALAIWTSGDAIVAAAHRLLGTPDGNWPRAISYAVLSVGVVVIAIYGHATIVALQRVLVPVIGILLLAGVFVFAPSFDPSVSTTDYALGGFWQTWMLSAVLGFAAGPSYVTSVGDYTRRISQHRYSDLRVASALVAGLFLGSFLPMTFGMFTAVSLADPTDSYVADMVNASPTWYVFAILVIALAGGVGQGVLNLYSSGLDLEGVVPRLPRLHTTAITAAISVVLLYAGVFIFNAVDSLTALTLVLNAVTVSWTAILVIGAIRYRVAGYDPVDLQAYAQRRKGGRYWFTAGWNLPAVAAWSAGSLFGVLAVDSQLYTGPLAMLANGIDLSCIGSATISSVSYLALTRRPAPLAAPPVAAADSTPDAQTAQ